MQQILCSKCGAAIAEGERFCRGCGTPAPEQSVSQAPAEPSFAPPQQPYAPPQQPYAPPQQPYMPPQQPYMPPQQQQYAPPTYQYTPYGQPAYPGMRIPRPGRGFGITSMVMGILAVVYCFIALMGVLSTVDTYAFRYAAESLLLVSLVYSVFGILALIFSTVSRGRGYRCRISSSGLIMGTIGLSMSALSVIICIAGM